VVNQNLSVIVKNSSDIDTVFDVIIEDTAHMFVDDAVPTIVNGSRTFAIKAKKAGNSRIQCVGRESGRVAYINVTSTEA